MGQARELRRHSTAVRPVRPSGVTFESTVGKTTTRFPTPSDVRTDAFLRNSMRRPYCTVRNARLFWQRSNSGETNAQRRRGTYNRQLIRTTRGRQGYRQPQGVPPFSFCFYHPQITPKGETNEQVCCRCRTSTMDRPLFGISWPSLLSFLCYCTDSPRSLPTARAEV